MGSIRGWGLPSPTRVLSHSTNRLFAEHWLGIRGQRPGAGAQPWRALPQPGAGLGAGPEASTRTQPSDLLVSESLPFSALSSNPLPRSLLRHGAQQLFQASVLGSPTVFPAEQRQCDVGPLSPRQVSGRPETKGAQAPGFITGSSATPAGRPWPAPLWPPSGPASLSLARPGPPTHEAGRRWGAGGASPPGLPFSTRLP